jgi:flagellar biosynthesis/type III secretory pathway M-ring protein FliF/YscJ
MGNLQSTPLGPWLERWNSLPRSRQVMLAAVGLGGFLLIWVLFLSSSSPKMVTAYSGPRPRGQRGHGRRARVARHPL